MGAYMSAVKKTAKISLGLLSFFVLLIVIGVGYIYVNMDNMAKNFAEQAASDALGVPVTIGKMKILLEDKKVIVSNIAVSNPKGYSKPNAITINEIAVTGESFSTALLTFANISVDGTAVNLEVNEKGTNLGDLKKRAEQKSVSSKPNNSAKQSSEDKPKHDNKQKDLKVIVKNFALTSAQLTPSITLLGDNDLATVKVPDIHLSGIGEKENGILAEEAIAQIMNSVLERFNESSNSAGFLEGLSLDSLNAIGVSTGEVFQKNLNKSYKKEVKKFKKGFQDLKGMFE